MSAPVQGGLTDEQYQEILRPILSRAGMSCYLNADSITLDPSDYRAIIDSAIEQHVIASQISEPIRTWQERLLRNGNMGNEQYFMECEIADLRAALGRAAAPVAASDEYSVIALLPDIHSKLREAYRRGSQEQGQDAKEYAAAESIMREWDLPDATTVTGAQAVASEPIKQLAEELHMRADALLESGDDDMEMIGEHYAGIADELDAAIKAMAPVGVTPKKAPKPLKRCAANRDGDCAHADCPQLRDNEPVATGRHCPLDNESED